MEVMDTYKTIMNDILYCPMNTVDWGDLLKDVFRRWDLPRWPQLNSDCVIPFYKGRVALWYLCNIWHLKQGDEVLMPAYNCGSEVDPFHSYGANVLFYRVDEKAQIDYEDIKKRCTPKTRIVYITHYFGWPHEIGPLYQWCRERDIKVVEDCAMSLFSWSSEGYLGTLGDASIFSFRKTLPVPDGAALVLKHPIDPDRLLLRPPSDIQTFRNMLPFVKSAALTMLNKCRLYKPLRRVKLKSFDFSKFPNEPRQNTQPDMPIDYYFDRRLINWSISSISCGILNRENPDFIVRQRRKNYLTIYDELSDLRGVKLLFDSLPEGVCPLGYVMKVPCRNKAAKALNAHGVAAFPWWEGYNKAYNWDQFPEARHLKDNLLFLPINQSLNEKHTKYIASCARRILA